MAKDYAAIYNSSNDSISLAQKFYLKEESVRGTMVFPVGADLFLNLPGGQIDYSQDFESSPQRSGRHNNNIIKKKKVTEFSFSTYFNIDETLGAPGVAVIDPAMRVLWKSLTGRETIPAGLQYDSTNAPDTTFTLIEVSDKWARQSPGAYVSGGNIQLPGDGEATIEWSGRAKTAFYAGIAKSTTDNDATNTITLLAGEGDRYVAGAAIMLVEADGVTRSADTPDGSPRTIQSIAGDVLTIDGAPLADADGGSADIYVVYYEPETPVAIDNPVTGLVGSATVAGLPSQCVRSLGINIQNNHEPVDYCYGEDGLAGSLFVPGDRVNAEITMSLNMNEEILKLFNNVQSFEAQDITAILGSSTGRHFEALLPRTIFQVPSFSVPDTGSIPVEFSGQAYQTALDAADEFTLSFK